MIQAIAARSTLHRQRLLHPMNTSPLKRTVPSWLCCSLIAALLLAGSATPAIAQMERERTQVDEEGPVSDLFWTHTVVTMASTRPLSQGTMNITIMHTFGRVSSGLQEFFGLDTGANIRLGADYGVTDWLSVGIGRTRYEKVVDGRATAHLLRQHSDDSPPVSLSAKGGVGIRTDEAGLDVADRLSYLSALMVSRKMNDWLSLQLMPMVSHFNVGYLQDVNGETQRDRHTHVALGLGAQAVITERMALTAEYMPVLGPRSDGTTNAAAVGLNIETGGHVFQVFLATSEWHTEQYTIARNRDAVLDGDLRIGFNVNRLFWLNGRD